MAARTASSPSLHGFRHGNGIALDADRTSALWFQEVWHLPELVLFAFPRPDESEGKPPSNGTALLPVGSDGSITLKRAALAEAGILDRPARGAMTTCEKTTGLSNVFDGF